MDYVTLKNGVFEKYYFNSYLPSTIGAYEGSNIFNYLMTLESIQENLTTEMNISKKWINNVPTWYTSKLPVLFSVPKYTDESEQDYIDRLLSLSGINQNDNTIIEAVFSLIKNAIINKTNIQIIEKLDSLKQGGVWGKDNSNTTKWDGVNVWISETNVQRTLFVVDMNFVYRGSDTDMTTWDYWIKPENYTKIEDIVKLYKPPGSTFELRINQPTIASVKTIFSNTLIVAP